MIPYGLELEVGTGHLHALLTIPVPATRYRACGGMSPGRPVSTERASLPALHLFGFVDAMASRLAATVLRATLTSCQRMIQEQISRASCQLCR